MKSIRIVPLFLVATSLAAQNHSPEVFAQIGYLKVGSDEGTIGDGTSYGGGFVVPIHRRIVAELDTQTVHVESTYAPDGYYGTRRTMVLGNVLYRRDKGRVHWFVGSGVGGQFVDSTSRMGDFAEGYTPEPRWLEISPGVYQYEHQDKRPIYFAPKAGFVAYVRKNLGVRVDVAFASWHVGVRIGMAYTFR